MDNRDFLIVMLCLVLTPAISALLHTTKLENTKPFRCAGAIR